MAIMENPPVIIAVDEFLIAVFLSPEELKQTREISSLQQALQFISETWLEDSVVSGYVKKYKRNYKIRKQIFMVICNLHSSRYKKGESKSQGVQVTFRNGNNRGNLLHIIRKIWQQNFQILYTETLDLSASMYKI